MEETEKIVVISTTGPEFQEKSTLPAVVTGVRSAKATLTY